METVPLSRLIDYSVQRTYHELSILTELLPRKSDMERKIEIVTFANRTRQLFVRLLALVKWAGSASKVDRCFTISSFLNKQSMLFTETADILAKMSRESLVQARLPSFQLLSAVEVLTSGTYTRLPSCIRDKIVPPDPITPEEKKTTLLRLNQIIQQRMVSSSLPYQMRNLKIEHGRITFHIPYEFELTLTLMSDKVQIPWRVLNVVILVEDKDTGEGKDLVHSLQINFLEHLIQEKLTENIRPLHDAFEILHCFCLSLQLEVLHAQAFRLCRERLRDFIKIDEYIPGSRLIISYWKDQLVDNVKSCKLLIKIKNQDFTEPLIVSHFPELDDKRAAIVNQAIRSDTLSIEKLLIYTTHERGKKILDQYRKKFEEFKYSRSFDFELCGSPPVLQISYIKPCMNSEKLILSVDALTGILMVHIPQFENCPFVESIQASLKNDLNNIGSLIQSLRIWVNKERYKKTGEFLFVTVKENIPFSPSETHPIVKDERQKLFFQFLKHVNYYLVVSFNFNNDDIVTDYYLLNVEPTVLEYGNKIKIENDQMSKSFLLVKSLIQLDINCILRSTYKSTINSIKSNFKRKFDEFENEIIKPNDCNENGFFITELSYLINFCEEKMAYGFLSLELQRRNFCHQVILSNTPDQSQYIDIIQMLIDNNKILSKLHKNLLSCSISLQGKISKTWMVTFNFCNSEIIEAFKKDENCFRKMVHLNCEYTGSQIQINQLIDLIKEEWNIFSKLYEILINLSKLKNLNNLLNLFDIELFNYKKLVLTYGQNRNYTITITWKNHGYYLSFGVIDSTIFTTNPHVIVSTQLHHEFNQHKSISTLIQVLNATQNSLLTIYNLTSIPMLGIIKSCPQVPRQTFCIIPQSSTHIRLIYRNFYCIDVLIQLDGFVAIRDGAYSIFEQVKIVEEMLPIQCLKKFLNKFVDKNATLNRCLSQNEDDDPPSPITSNCQIMDTSIESPYMYQPQSIRNISSPMNSSMSMNDSSQSALANQLQRSNMHSSNPNTPASPHTSLLSQSGYVPSPSHPEPSPGNLFGVNSPINSSLHAPSPSTFHPQPSPSSQHMQPSPAPPSNSSNFNIPMQSPVSAGWPNSPQVYRPSPRPVQSPAQQQHSFNTANQQLNSSTQSSNQRTIPPKSWAAAFPTLLTQQGFELMCKPNAPIEVQHHGNNASFGSLSQLERFLGCVFMRTHLQRLIKSDEMLTLINPIRPEEIGVIQFKNEALHFKISMHQLTMQSLQVKITAEIKNQWSSHEVEILEKFFDSKVVCAPFKPDAFLAYNRIINTPLKLLKDCIHLMQLELFPERNFKWTLNWCLTISPATQMMVVSPGMSAFLHQKSTILFFLQFTQNILNDPQTFVVPFVYDINKNVLEICSKNLVSNKTPTAITVMHHLLQRFQKFNNQTTDCPISNCIKEIMCNDLIASQLNS